VCGNITTAVSCTEHKTAVPGQREALSALSLEGPKLPADVLEKRPECFSQLVKYFHFVVRSLPNVRGLIKPPILRRHMSGVKTRPLSGQAVTFAPILFTAIGRWSYECRYYSQRLEDA